MPRGLRRRQQRLALLISAISALSDLLVADHKSSPEINAKSPSCCSSIPQDASFILRLVQGESLRSPEAEAQAEAESDLTETEAQAEVDSEPQEAEAQAEAECD